MLPLLQPQRARAAERRPVLAPTGLRRRAAPPRQSRPAQGPPGSATVRAGWSCHRRSTGEGERRAPPTTAASRPPGPDC